MSIASACLSLSLPRGVAENEGDGGGDCSDVDGDTRALIQQRDSIYLHYIVDFVVAAAA